MNHRQTIKIFLLVIVMIISFCIGKSNGDPNDGITYGDTGFPKNCRAILAANIDGWREGKWEAEEIMNSLDRNCGRYGYSWGQ